MHKYTTVAFDGKKYRYICCCGHKVVTSDGKMPIKVSVPRGV